MSPAQAVQVAEQYGADQCRKELEDPELNRVVDEVIQCHKDEEAEDETWHMEEESEDEEWQKLDNNPLATATGQADVVEARQVLQALIESTLPEKDHARAEQERLYRLWGLQGRPSRPSSASKGASSSSTKG